ncbi:MAG: pentapeptide repeat-containing protein [Cyanobacteria bacterium P01_E01_bin.34]
MALANLRQILTGMFEQGERDFRKFKDQLREADLSGINLEGCDLSGLDLAGTNFKRANLESANLTGTNLGFATLVDATLTRATLRNADLTCARAEGVDMRFCVLALANLSSANLLGSQLEPSIFTGAIYNAKTQFPEGFDRSQKGLVRAAPVPQSVSPSLSSMASPLPSTPVNMLPNAMGQQPQYSETSQSASQQSQSAVEAANPQPAEDKQPNPNGSNGESQTSSSTPPKRKVLFRGRWVEM